MYSRNDGEQEQISIDEGRTITCKYFSDLKFTENTAKELKGEKRLCQKAY